MGKIALRLPRVWSTMQHPKLGELNKDWRFTPNETFPWEHPGRVVLAKNVPEVYWAKYESVWSAGDSRYDMVSDCSGPDDGACNGGIYRDERGTPSYDRRFVWVPERYFGPEYALSNEFGEIAP